MWYFPKQVMTTILTWKGQISCVRVMGKPVYVYLQISIYLVISPWKYPVALEIVYNLLDVKIRIQVPFLRA